MLFQVEDPAARRHRVAVAGIVVRRQAHARGREALDPEDVEHLLVEGRLPQDRVVRVDPLDAEEPVAGHALEVASGERAELVARVERHAGAQIVVVVVPHAPAHRQRGQPVTVLGPGRPAERSSDRGAGGGVLHVHAENGQARLFVEVVHVPGHRAKRRAELGIQGKDRRDEPRRFALRFDRFGRGDLPARLRKERRREASAARATQALAMGLGTGISYSGSALRRKKVAASASTAPNHFT